MALRGLPGVGAVRCGVVRCCAVWWRLAQAGPARLVGRLVAAVTALAVPVVLAGFLAAGPLQPGWAQPAAVTTVLLGGGR
ncbi:hypothetical protein [Streptomyces sp. BK205]|uniref:hypothetical protein n=1 Tax=Streptomyces sp. BK205 TaxID=2512164 RepID=UPI001FB3EC4B|nr:hypothetical protein [Streptomyces sp. BK205]